MDDVLRRLGIVESLCAETREDVSAIKGAFGHLATKADLNDLKADVNICLLVQWLQTAEPGAFGANRREYRQELKGSKMLDKGRFKWAAGCRANRHATMRDGR